jgi:hydroxyacylglutathione hydrolase
VIIRGVTVGLLEENCWLVMDESSREAVLVDPGDEGARLIAALDAERAELRAIWLTHAHFDHLGAIAHIIRERKVPIWVHPLDMPLYNNAVVSAARFGLEVEQPPSPDRTLSEGDAVTVGGFTFDVWHLPGHSPGHVGFVGQDVLLGGDTLFAGSVGRTDLPLCDPAAFQKTLARLATLPPVMKVLPGHGPATTIGRELASNPYLRQFAAL